MKGQEEREGVEDEGRKEQGVVWGCDQHKEEGWGREEGGRKEGAHSWAVGAYLWVVGTRSWVLNSHSWVVVLVCGQ